MLVKSKEDCHLDDLREKFKTLHLYDIKLNPNKCVFGVSSGKFLDFLVSQWGVKANPDKIQAMLEMPPPKNIMEVQSLNNRVATLNKFVSRAIDKCLSFFKTLKKAFEWTNKCQKAFEKLKIYLTSLPLLNLLSPMRNSPSTWLYPQRPLIQPPSGKRTAFNYPSTTLAKQSKGQKRGTSLYRS